MLIAFLTLSKKPLTIYKHIIMSQTSSKCILNDIFTMHPCFTQFCELNLTENTLSCILSKSMKSWAAQKVGLQGLQKAKVCGNPLFANSQ